MFEVFDHRLVRSLSVLSHVLSVALCYGSLLVIETAASLQSVVISGTGNFLRLVTGG